MAFFNSNVDTLLRTDLDEAYEDMAFGGNYAALIGLFEKQEASGDGMKVTVKDSFGAGQGATAATAYANAGLASRFSFQVTPFKTYGFSIVPLDQAAWTKGDNAIVDLLLDESKTAMDSCKSQTDQALASDGYGTLGTIQSHTGTGPWVLTLESGACRNIGPNQILVSKATPSTGTLVSGTASVTAVNANKNQITIAGSGGFTVTDGFVVGTQGTMAASTSPVIWPGIPGWIPPASARPVSGSDNFFGLNRSQDEQKLAGSYLDGTKMSILEGINQLAFAVADVPGSMLDLVVGSFQTKGKVMAALQTQNRYGGQTKVKGAGINVFYPSFEIEGPHGPMSFIGSSHWANNLVLVATSGSWKLGAPDNKPFVPASSTATPVIEIPGADSVVVQYRANLMAWCDAPGHNGMLTIKST